MKHLGFDFNFGAELPVSQMAEWQRDANGYRVTFTYDRRKASFDFWQGSGITRDPQAADVMACLVSDTQHGHESFEEFCGNLGYDTDSRKAEKMWRACQRTGDQLYRLFGADYNEALDHDWEGANA